MPKIKFISPLFFLLTGIILGYSVYAQNNGVAGAPQASEFRFPTRNFAIHVNDGEFGFHRYGNTYHLGSDSDHPAGTPVYAAANGMVKHIGVHSRFGTVILVEHFIAGGEYVVSLYGHLKNPAAVKEGQEVKVGQLLGYLGDYNENGGWPPHIHFAIRKGGYVPVESTWVYWGLGSPQELNNWYDPVDFVKARGQMPKYTAANKIVVGPGISGRAHVRFLRFDGVMTDPGGFFAYESSFFGGADVATGDLGGDKKKEIIVGAGPGRPSTIKIFDPNLNQLTELTPFGSNFRSGLNVAAGDFDGDKKDEIIVGPRRGGGPHLKVLELDGREIFSQFPFNPYVNSGIDVASCDFNRDGKDEIIVGSGPETIPQVKYYQNKKLSENTIIPYPEQFRGGVRVTCGDTENDNRPEIITGAGPGGGPHLRVFRPDGEPTGYQFFPFHILFRGGVDVSTYDMENDGQDEVITSQMSDGQTWMKVYRANRERTILSEFIAFDPSFQGGAFVAGLTQ